MEWEITEKLADEDAIIHCNIVENQYIEWDFSYKSNFELCAVFNGSQTLEEYKRLRIRPFLYHKNLWMRHKIIQNEEIDGYKLYPATIRDGKLYIGASCYENFISLKEQKEKICVILQKKAFSDRNWFAEKNFSEKDKIILEVDTASESWTGMIYYKFEENSSGWVYGTFVAGREVVINVKEQSEITFYTDANCVKELGRWKI